MNCNNLVGKVFCNVFVRDLRGQDELVFEELGSGTLFIFGHDQDCCETVFIEDINGYLFDLVGSPILLAEEVVSDCEDCGESGTWTFYKFATRKGYVTVRWLGESNGFYSESVDLYVKEGRPSKYNELFDL